MTEFSFYKSKEIYGEIYYQLPKVFFTNEKYKKMSNDSKIAYAILKDRFNHSIKNNWVDQEDNIYFIYTVEQLKELLNCAEGKVSKIKKELETVGLLFQKRSGFQMVNGKQENSPNKLYLGKPEVTPQDVYLIQNNTNPNGSNGIAKIANPSESQQFNDSNGIAKITNPSKSNNINGSNGIAKIADNLYKEKDTLLDTSIDTERAQIQQMELLRHFAKTHEQETCLDTRNLDLIALFSNTVKEAEQTIGIILRAKNQIQKDHSCFIIAEDWQDEIESTLRRVYHKLKTDEKIKNQANYMFGSFKVTFDNIARDMQKKDHISNANSVPMYNWLEVNSEQQ